MRLAVRQALVDVVGPITVGCSGGADSVALAAAVAFEAPERASLVSVDHGLQPGSAVRARATAALGYELGFACAQAVTVRVGAPGGPEAAARAARYTALDAAGYPVVLGHTLDDQAETVLLGLGRGSGPSALRAMTSTPTRIRPFLRLRRTTTRQACEALGLPVWDDPHNDDRRYTRVRVRHEVLPLFEEVLGGGVAEALARTASQIRLDSEALDQLADRASTDRVAELAELPAAIRHRVLRRWLLAAGTGPPAAAHVAAVDRLVTHWHGQGPIEVPGGFGVLRRSGRLMVMPLVPPLVAAPVAPGGESS